MPGPRPTPPPSLPQDVAPPPGPPEAPVARLCHRYTGLLALNLTAIIDDIEKGFPADSADSTFHQAWHRVAGLRGGRLRQFLTEPLVEAWIGRAERLLASPVLAACPEHHIPRLLARFSALLPSLATGPDGLAAGTAVILGSGAIPLLESTAYLHSPGVRKTLIHWSCGDRLILRSQMGETLVEIDPAAPSPGRYQSGWRLDVARLQSGLRLFERPPCCHAQDAPESTGFLERFDSAWEALPTGTKRLLTVSTRVVGPGCLLHPVDAPGWLDGGARPSPQTLARGLSRNLLRRLTAVYRFDTGRQFAEGLGMPLDAAIDTLADALLERRPSEASFVPPLLERMLQLCESPRKGGQVQVPPPGDRLDFRPVLAVAGVVVEDPGRWIQPKTRHHHKAPTWQILDALLEVSATDQERLRQAFTGGPRGEVQQFGLACLDYFAGHFPAALGHAVACLELDAGCEEYWLLAAFLTRYFGAFSQFDDLVFETSRDRSTLNRLRGLL
jgi:hypothetical protein